jgi:hypothetical protein
MSGSGGLGITKLEGCSAGFFGGKFDWYLAVWRMAIQDEMIAAEGWHDVRGAGLKGGYDHETGTARMILSHPDSGTVRCVVPLPAELSGAWLGTRMIGSWHTLDGAERDGGRFEIWSESQRVSLAAAVHKGGDGARDMNWDQYIEYRDQGIFSLQDETGLWRGGYQDRTGEATEDLHLWFIDGIIRGRGKDKDGNFLLLGSYHPHSSSVHWRKHYTSPHRLFEYRGWWKGGRITGEWAMIGDPDYCGPFEIEPHLEPEKTSLWFA